MGSTRIEPSHRRCYHLRPIGLFNAHLFMYQKARADDITVLPPPGFAALVSNAPQNGALSFLSTATLEK